MSRNVGWSPRPDHTKTLLHSLDHLYILYQSRYFCRACLAPRACHQHGSQVRRTLKQDGWDVLTTEEKRFTMLDRVLRPDLYLWMKGSEQAECVADSSCRTVVRLIVAGGGVQETGHWATSNGITDPLVPCLVHSFARWGAPAGFPRRERKVSRGLIPRKPVISHYHRHHHLLADDARLPQRRRGSCSGTRSASCPEATKRLLGEADRGRCHRIQKPGWCRERRGRHARKVRMLEIQRVVEGSYSVPSMRSFIPRWECAGQVSATS